MLSCSVPNQTLITAWYRIDLKDSWALSPAFFETAWGILLQSSQRTTGEKLSNKDWG